MGGCPLPCGFATNHTRQKCSNHHVAPPPFIRSIKIQLTCPWDPRILIAKEAFACPAPILRCPPARGRTQIFIFQR